MQFDVREMFDYSHFMRVSLKTVDKSQHNISATL
jgi:hypothetical protein